MPTIRRRVKRSPSKFYSMKVNPKGASIGNLVYNIKQLPSDVKKVYKAVKSAGVGKRRRR